MSHSITVFLSKTNIPTVDAVLEFVRKEGYNLEIHEPWDFYNNLGYLPVVWEGNESGCDIEVGSINKKDKTALREAGHEADCEITFTVYSDWNEMKVASVLSYALATLGKGCISEQENSYFNGAQAKAWVQQIIEARPLPDLSPSKDTAMFESALEEMNGQTVAGFITDDSRLAVALSSGHSISGMAWELLHDNQTIKADHYAPLRAKQLEKLISSDNRIKILDDMEKDLLNAASLDEKGMEHAKSILDKIQKPLVVESVTRPKPNTVKLALNHCTLLFHSFGELTLSVNVKTPVHEFKITADGGFE